MGKAFSSFLPGVLLAAVLLLTGCESSEERAERHFNSGMELLEAGEVTQALLEFRNTLRLQPNHIDARMQVAQVHRQRGHIADALREFRQVIERDPDHFEARIAAAEMAAKAGNWEEIERHGRAAQDLKPDDPRVALTAAMLDYRAARMAEDRAAAEAPAAALDRMIADAPANELAWRLLIDHALDDGSALDDGLRRIEQALEHRPDVMNFHEMRLQVLERLDRPEAVRAALEAMLEQFPGHRETEQLYVRWLMQQDERDTAEAFMRARAEREGAGYDEAMELVQFVGSVRGRQAARDELDRLLAAEVAPDRLGAVRARMLFEEGDAAGAIAELRSRIDVAADGDARNDLRVMLARFLAATGERPEAEALVEAVLEDDASHVDALKLRAARLIETDRPVAAISALRTAQAAAPRDATIMLMMGQAHEREGSRDLAGERYAQAVEMSGEAAGPSLVYVEYLRRENRLDSAESVLTSALNRSPDNMELLAAMGELQLRRGEWDRVQRLVWQLRGLDTDAAERMASALEADLMLRQGRTDDTIAFLEDLVRRGSGDDAALAALIRTQVMQGRTEGAVTLLEELLEERPDDPALRFLRAGLHVLDNEVETAEEIYRDLLQAHPVAEAPLRALYGILEAQGRPDDAGELLEDVITLAPEAMMPQILLAARKERNFDIDGAIEIYERLYAVDSSNVILANNLASLLSAHRDDPETIERAHAIARRLRNIEVPAFQDTYGWIQYRRGNYEEALRYLQPAAAGLPDDPLVQFHLGMAYHALDRHAEAQEALSRAVGIAGDAPLPQFDQARTLLDELGGH